MSTSAKTPEEMRAILAEKAATDEDFRSRLLSDAKGTIQKEFDVEIPEGIHVHVHEDSSSTAHLVLPPDPKLGDEQLAAVAGGKQSGLYWCM